MLALYLCALGAVGVTVAGVVYCLPCELQLRLGKQVTRAAAAKRVA